MTEWIVRTVDDEPPASPSNERYCAILGTFASSFLVAVGAYLPWLRINPEYEPDGLQWVPSLMTPGVEQIHVVLLIPAGVVVAALVVDGPTRGWALASLVMGLWVVLFSVLLVVVQYTAQGLRFVPELGWMLSVLGGLLFAAVGGLALFEDEVPASHRRL